MKNNSRFYFYLGLVSFIAACGLHLYLSNEFYDVRLGLSGNKSLCNINQTFNCDAVAASSFASLFGIPLALFGLFTNLVALIFFVIGDMGWSEHPSLVKRAGLLLTSWIAIMSLIMATISTFFLGHICLFCVGAYGISVLSALAVFKLTPLSEIKKIGEDLGLWISQFKWVLIFILIIPLAAFMAHKVFLDTKGFKTIEKLVAVGMADWTSAPVKNLSTQGLHKRSSLSPVLTVVEFADFGCPHCRFAAPSLQAFKAAHQDVELIFKPFPLDGQCNVDIPQKGDGLRCEITYLVLCTEQLSQKGWDLYDWTFENQDDLFRKGLASLEQVKEKAIELGADAKDLLTCTQGDSIRDEVRAMAAEGKAAGVQGTPSIFVNNKLLPYGQTLPVLQSVYEQVKKAQ